jgi:hypothetical protein
MKVPVGEVYIPNDEDKRTVIELARKITVVLDDNGPVPFQIGINALVMVLASALSAKEVPNDKKIKLAKGISEAILANIIFEDVDNGVIN